MLNQNDNNIQQAIAMNLKQQASAGQFSSMQVANHSHNGTDSPRINLANAVANSKYRVAFLGDNSSGSSAILGHDTFSAGIINPSSIKFFGVAYTAITSVLVNGAAELGNCFNANANNVVENPITVEACSYGFLGSSVTAGVAPYLAYVYSGSEVVKLIVSAWTNSSITFEVYLEAGWSLEGQLLIT